MIGTPWHVTISTYGARLHGDDRPTVDRMHNRYGTPYLQPDTWRERIERVSMVEPAMVLTLEHRLFIQDRLPCICDRGGWELIACAAAPDHVHVILRALPRFHGKEIRRWLKFWLTQDLQERWKVPIRSDGMSYWSEGGSARALHDQEYYENAVSYVHRQRAVMELGDRKGTGAIGPGSL